MGVVDWDLIDQGEIQQRGGASQIRLRGIAFCSSLDDSINALRIGLSQFQRWQSHPTEPGFYVEDFEATQRKHTPRWEFTVTYTDQVTKDPLAIPARIGEIKSFKLDGATVLDWNNTPILNTAGEPPEPFSKPEQIIVFPFIKNIPPDQPDWLLDFESCINSDVVRIGSKVCDPLTALINAITISEVQEQGDTQYRTATVEVWRRKGKWLEYFPSRGFNEKVTVIDQAVNSNGVGSGFTKKTKTVLRPILINGEPPDKPQFLDADGKWLKDPTPDQIKILTAQIYPAISFNAFPLK